MKHLLRFILLGWAALLIGIGAQAQETSRSLPVAPLPLEENNGDGMEPASEKWNAEGRLFMSLYSQYKAKPSKNKKLEQRLQADFGLRQMGENRKSSRDYLPVFLEYNGEEVLLQVEALGFKVQTRLEGICTGLIPVDAAEEIAAVEGVIRISASLADKVYNDKSRKANKVDKAQENYSANRLKQAYDGKGVIVGIIDIGFDYTHPTFYTDASDKSTYRVKKVWDQRATTGTKPSGYSYGAEYSGTTAILAAARDQDKSGTHATHVAGTACGSGAGTAYKGMAPGADMVFVSTNMTSTGVFDGISYIEKYAAAQNKPCVVNMSLGNDIGPHDGTTALNKACDQISRKGFVMVASAGNSGDTKLHYLADVQTEAAATTYLKMDDTEDVYIDCWGNNKKHFWALVAVMQDGAVIGHVSYRTNVTGGKKEVKSGSTVLATVNATCETNANNGQPHILMSLDATSAREKGYDIMLQFQVLDGENGIVTIHSWISPGEFVQGDTQYTHSSSVAASNNVLSVAAYNTRTTWKNSEESWYQYTSVGYENGISSFSSRGPLANLLPKPDIAAPGAGIISAGNSYNAANIAASRLIAKTKVDGKDYPWVLEQGTSMSSPAMAGITALFLQKDPTLDITTLKEVLSRTAVHDTSTGDGYNSTWGYGKVDALAGLKYLEAKDAPPVEEVTVTIAQTEGGSMIIDLADGTEVNSGDRIPKGDTLWMMADADEGYYFESWWDGNTEELREYEVVEDVTISAVFVEKPHSDLPIVQIEQSIGGTIQVTDGEGSIESGVFVPAGTVLTLKAIPEKGYVFDSWWDGNTEASREYDVEVNVTISATFKPEAGPEPEKFVVRITESPSGTIQVTNGSEPVLSGDTLPKGTALTLKATPEKDYRFVSWWDGNTSKLRAYVLNKDVTISATFEKTVGLETEQESPLKIYPNPSDGHVVLEAGIAARIEVFSPQGARLRAFDLGQGERYDLDLSGEPSGVYYARLSGQGQTSVFKILLR